MNKKILLSLQCLLPLVICSCGNNYKSDYNFEDDSEEVSTSIEEKESNSSVTSSSIVEEESSSEEAGPITIDNAIIDGKDDDFANQNVLSFTETKSGITVSSKAYLSASGLHVYTYVNDPSVYISSEKEFYQNDSVEYYIDPNPEYSLSLEALAQRNKIRTDCFQVRANALGENDTWIGRQIGGETAYPWARAYADIYTAGVLDGQLNVANGATGYSIEVFIPYKEFLLDEAPDEIGLMVAFNNVENREDTSRTWFSFKGMSHSEPTSYARVTKDGFNDYSCTPTKPLNTDFNDEFYANINPIYMYETDESNNNGKERAALKGKLGEDGVYFIVDVKDKVCNYLSDNIWENDGIEILIDTTCCGSTSFYYDGIYRFGVDVAKGTETDICISGHNNYVGIKSPIAVNSTINQIEDTSIYQYKYEYFIEVFIPYSSLGLEEKPEMLTFAYAVKTPNEMTHILNRANGEGVLEFQDWLWIDRHYPQNPGEYFVIREDGVTTFAGSFAVPKWKSFDEVAVQADSKDRYNYRGYAANDGVYFNMVQYVDSYTVGSVSGDWTSSTHIELELWNGDIGYGWGGTYFAFFIDGSYYVNNTTKMKYLGYKVTVIENEATAKFRYTISYEVYISFDNNLAAPQDGPYAYIQFMSLTPGESTEGYENSKKITKDPGSQSERALWTDKCNSFEFRKDGIVSVDR